MWVDGEFAGDNKNRSLVLKAWLMDDFIEDYVAYELIAEAFCVQTDVECPNCESALLYDQEREVYLCPDCRGEFVDNAG